jgi:hypothetical protein
MALLPGVEDSDEPLQEYLEVGRRAGTPARAMSSVGAA